jgi:flagellin-like hook-associated protein FlgL
MKISNSLFALGPQYSSISQLRQQMDNLQLQLSTGKRVNSLSELGDKRVFDLSLRNRLSRLDAYSNSMDMVNLRLSFLNQAMERFDVIESDARLAALPSGAGADGINLATTPNQAKSQLDEVITLLNTEVNGRHLFGGNVTDRKPVAGLDALLNGEGGKDGFRTIVSERKLADAGVDGRGRLTASSAGAVTTLAEDGVHPFGLKLSGVSTDSSTVAVTSPAGAPQSLTVDFTALPLDGQSIHLTLTMPDGATKTASFKAVVGVSTGSGEFQIGADGTATAASFQAALETKLTEIGGNELAGSSVFAAADNFFNGSGETVLRVDGPPFETATATVAASAADTVLWYQGQDSAGNPRQTARTRIDDSTSVDYGVQANESGLVELVRSLAAFAVESFPSSDSTAEGRYNAMTGIQSGRLAESHNNTAGSIEIIMLELGTAQATLGSVRDRQSDYRVQLDTMLADIEAAPMDEVATRLLSLQTRLQASYEVMSIVSQLSLVNFIR